AGLSGQANKGRAPPVGRTRRGLEQLLVGFDDIASGGLHVVRPTQLEWMPEGDGLAARSGGHGLPRFFSGQPPSAWDQERRKSAARWATRSLFHAARHGTWSLHCHGG